MRVRFPPLGPKESERMDFKHYKDFTDLEWEPNDFWTIWEDGEEWFAYDNAVMILLAESILFVGLGALDKKSLELFVSANDIFAWGCADSEPTNVHELQDLVMYWFSDPDWGLIKWCCIHRNEQPQYPIKRDMKTAGVWDEDMESLPENSFEKSCREMSQKDASATS